MAEIRDAYDLMPSSSYYVREKKHGEYQVLKRTIQPWRR